MKRNAKSTVVLVALLALFVGCLWLLLTERIGRPERHTADSCDGVEPALNLRKNTAAPKISDGNSPPVNTSRQPSIGIGEPPVLGDPPTEAVVDVQLADGSQLPRGRVRLVTIGYVTEVIEDYEGQPLKFGPFAQGCALEIIVGHDLVEYEDCPTFSFTAKEVASGKTLKCVVPLASEPQSALDIDLSLYSPALRLKVSVVCALGGVFSKECVGGEIYKTPLTQADWVLQVKIDGDAKWRSGDIRLIAGQRVYVRPAPEEPGAVRFKVCNTQGELVGVALVTCESAAMAQYKKLLTLPAGTSVSGEYALSGTDGIVKLGGLRSGDYGLLVYADGYEPKSVYGVFVSGKETDLGTIVLDKKK